MCCLAIHKPDIRAVWSMCIQMGHRTTKGVMSIADVETGV